jgi:hypothetical protein
MLSEAGVFVADFDKQLNIECLINGEKVSV